MAERIYCIQLVDAARDQTIRIRADSMEEVGKDLYEFKRGSCLVGRIDSAIVAWWIEEK